MERGSVLFYSGSVNHGGGANRTDEVRTGINITYNLAWLRQEENQYLATSREIAQTSPVELLRLMGYERGAYSLGCIDDLRDPIEAVLPGFGGVGLAVADKGRAGGALSSRFGRALGKAPQPVAGRGSPGRSSPRTIHIG